MKKNNNETVKLDNNDKEKLIYIKKKLVTLRDKLLNINN